jgi:hypothetical protein
VIWLIHHLKNIRMTDKIGGTWYGENPTVALCSEHFSHYLCVRIATIKGKPHVFITLHAAQEEPQNLIILKQNILRKWGNFCSYLK